MRLQELQKKYEAAVGAADAIRKQYTNTDKGMTEDEAKQFDGFMDEADKVWEEIEREQKAAAAASRITEPVSGLVLPTTKEIDPAKAGEAQMKAFRQFLRYGDQSLEFRNAAAELKIFQADMDTSGGFLVTPQMFVSQLLKNVDDMVYMRQYSTIYPLGAAESLGVPSLDTQMNDADWTTELQTGSLDEASVFGKRELRPHPFAKRVKVSNKLLRSALMDPEAHVRERLAYKFAITEEKGFLTGTGAEQPLGIFTASAQGISTGRDVTVGTATAITADGLIDVLHTLKPQYWPKARWILHRDAVKNVRKLKDGNGQYLWQPGIAGGVPNTILDKPYIMSEFAPATFTTGLYVAVVGDFSFYWIADSMGLTIQRVNELYAESNSVGFIGRAECDGMPVLEEAFVRAKMG